MKFHSYDATAAVVISKNLDNGIAGSIYGTHGINRVIYAIRSKIGPSTAARHVRSRIRGNKFERPCRTTCRG